MWQVLSRMDRNTEREGEPQTVAWPLLLLLLSRCAGVEMQANSVRSRPGLAVGCNSQRLVDDGGAGEQVRLRKT